MAVETLLLNRRLQFACKKEAANGTAETLAAADINVRVRRAVLGLDIDMFDQDLMQADLSHITQLAGMRRMTLTVEMIFAGSGAAATATFLKKTLELAGMIEAVSTDCQYTPETPSTSATATVGLWVGPDRKTASVDSGRFFRMKGARVRKLTLQVRAGQPVVVVAEFIGAYVDAADTTVFSSPTYPTTVPPVALGVGLTIGSWAPKFRELEITCDNTVAAVEDPGAAAGGEASGILEYAITDRKWSGRIDPLLTRLASKDVLADLLANTEAAMTLQIGGTAGNILKLDAPKTQIVKPDFGDRDGMATMPLDLAFNRSAGNDEFKITTK